MAEAIGTVTHYYDKISVAIIKLNKELKPETEIHIKGKTTDEKVMVSEIQFDHNPIDVGEKGQEVGIKTTGKVREGDEVYLAE